MWSVIANWEHAIYLLQERYNNTQTQAGRQESWQAAASAGPVEVNWAQSPHVRLTSYITRR